MADSWVCRASWPRALLMVLGAFLALGAVGVAWASPTVAVAKASGRGALRVVADLRFPVNSGAYFPVTDPSTGVTFVGNSFDARIWAVDPTTLRLKVLHAGDCCGQYAMVPDASLGLLLTVGIDDYLHGLNIRSGQVTDYVVPRRFLASPSGLAVNPVTQVLYMTDTYNNNLYVFDIRTRHLRAALAVGSQPCPALFCPALASSGILVDPRTNTVYDATGGTLYALNGATNKVTASAHIAAYLFLGQADPVTNALYAEYTPTGVSPTALVSIDARALAVRHRTWYQAPNGAWVNIRTDMGYVLVGNPAVLIAVDEHSGQVTYRLPLGVLPSGITGDPGTGRIYVTYMTSQSASRMLVIQS